MRPIITVSIFLLVSISGESLADCSSPRVNNLIGLLNNQLVCGIGAGGTDQWQEEHRGVGTLWERAKGPSDPVDPSHPVGTWSVSGNGTDSAEVCYNYTGGSTYCFSVHGNGGSYSFCNGGTEAAIGTISSIPAADINACGFF